MAVFTSFMRSSLFPSVLGLSLLILLGAGCRGGGDPPAPPTPPDPTAIFGSSDATSTLPSDPVGMSCNHEYYPLRLGYFIQYRTTYPPTSKTPGEGYYALRVMRVTGDSVYLKSGYDRPSGARISSDVEYRCIHGGLYAAGYGNTDFLNPGGTDQNRMEVRTERAEGEFLPRHISAGSRWTSHFKIKITPVDPETVDLDGRTLPPVGMSVDVERHAIGVEHVRVPTGEYDAMKIETATFIDDHLSMMGTEWWVKNVGMVKSTYAAGRGADQNIVTEATTVTVPR